MSQLRFTVLLAALLFSGCHLHWATVDDSHGPAFPQAATSTRNLSFVGGSMQIGGQPQWRVRKSDDRGATWFHSDAGESSATFGFVSGLASNAAGTIYAVGAHLFPDDELGHWIVRKSADAGRTWATVDDITGIDYEGNHYNAYTAIAAAITDDGTVYVTGKGSRTGSNWITRRSTDGGVTWTTSDVLASESVPRAIAVRGNTDVFVVGYGTFGSNGETRWIVRHRGASGTWTNVDIFPAIGRSTPMATSVTVHPSGKVLVAGQSNSGHWTVRSASVTSPTVWTTIDDFVPPGSGSNGVPNGIAVGPRGSVFVAGMLEDHSRPSSDAPSTRSFAIRAATGADGPFVSSDSIVVKSRGTDIRHNNFGMTLNAAGDMLIAAPIQHVLGDGRYNWVVRRYSKLHVDPPSFR